MASLGLFQKHHLKIRAAQFVSWIKKAESYDLAPTGILAPTVYLGCILSHWLNFNIHRNSWEETDSVRSLWNQGVHILKYKCLQKVHGKCVLEKKSILKNYCTKMNLFLIPFSKNFAKSPCTCPCPCPGVFS